MTAWVTPWLVRYSQSCNKPFVVVANVARCSATTPSSTMRTPATTVSLCTSNPAHRACKSSTFHLQKRRSRRAPCSRNLTYVLRGTRRMDARGNNRGVLMEPRVQLGDELNASGSNADLAKSLVKRLEHLGYTV